MTMSKNISDEEFLCKCGCGTGKKDEGVIKMMDAFMAFVNYEEKKDNTLLVHCITRCKNHQEEIYRRINADRKYRKLAPIAVPKDSKHLYSIAVDFHIGGMGMKKLHDYAHKAIEKGILKGGVGFYSWGLHCDTGAKRTWTEA